jgi:hypothetical protein
MAVAGCAEVTARAGFSVLSAAAQENSQSVYW